MKNKQEYGVFDIFGRAVKCLILKRHPAGTFDVQRLSDGQCFRVSGIWDGDESLTTQENQQ